MNPRAMPTARSSTKATGARQLVVQDAAETIRWLLRSLLSLTPNTTVMSSPVAGAEISTRLAPASRCLPAASRLVKRPVHSSSTSMPSFSQGRSAGSRSANTLIVPAPMLMPVFVVLTLPGKRPCTES